MKKIIPILVLLIFTALFLNAQETQPCIEYKPTGFALHNPKTFPIFPGCATFKENNDSLNNCFRNQIASLIADKLEMEFSPGSQNDNTRHYYKVAVIINVDFTGKLEMKIQKKRQNPFEDLLVEKLNEISNETIGIVPAKTQEGYCTNYKYKLPISFDLSDL